MFAGSVVLETFTTEEPISPTTTGPTTSAANASGHATGRVVDPVPTPSKEDQRPLKSLRSLPVSLRRELWLQRAQPYRTNIVARNRARWTQRRFPKAVDMWRVRIGLDGDLLPLEQVKTA